MKPEPFLDSRGIKYFKQIAGVLKARGMDKDEYSLELSMLANEYVKYSDGAMQVTELGYYVTAKSGWQQVAPWVTLQKEALSTIGKLSPKFGLTPADFERIKSAVKAPEIKSDLELMM